MSRRRIASFVVLTACFVASRLVAAWERGDDNAAAIVSEMRGSATVEESGKSRRAVQIYDWVTEGATIDVSKRSTVVIVLASGSRFELAEGARVTVRGAGLPTSATVRTLPSLPPLPLVPPIAASSGVGSRNATGLAGAVRIPGEGAAVRIRGSSVRNLYPAGDATIADRTRLQFDEVPVADAYIVSIEGLGGSVFGVTTRQPLVVVPPGVLDAGQRYVWRVTVESRVVSSVQAAAMFTTLPQAVVQARDAFVARLRRDDPRDAGLLARVDLRLGLLGEARDELRAAAERAPADRHIRRLLDEINRQFESRK